MQPEYGRHETEGGREVNAGRLWAGGVAAAVVAAGITVVGFLVTRGILDIQILVPQGEDHLVNASLAWYASAAALAALIATGIAHLLLLGVPEPMRFFGWIIGLAIVAAALLPFVFDADLEEQVTAAVLNLVIGIGIISIVGRVASTSYSA